MVHFRKYFQALDHYTTSYYWDGVPLGDYSEGVQCQDLTRLTFDDSSFDLIVTSDIFEHVRRPFEGFQEIDRVLKPGGMHIFSIPVQHPMRIETVFRVDTSGDEDIHILRPITMVLRGAASLLYTLISVATLLRIRIKSALIFESILRLGRVTWNQ